MEEEEYNLGTGLSIITIVMDETKIAPKIDLDNCPPHIAIVIFAKAIEALEELVPFPTVVYQGKTVVSDIYVNDDEETSD
jgi:hypothetical protein